MANKLMVKTDSDEAIQSLLNTMSSFINDFAQSNKKERKRGNKLDESESLDIVIEVVNAILKEKLKISRAFSIIAKKHGITTTGVRNKCAGQLGINLKTFKSYLANNHQALISQIIKTFPDKESYIKSKLG